MVTGFVSAFVNFATVRLPEIFIQALIDVMCDIITYGLVFAVVGCTQGPAARDIAINIAQEVEFSFPPAFTVYMTAAVTIRLANMLIGYVSRTMANYIDRECMPRIAEVGVDQLTQTLSTSVATSVLDTLPHALTLTLSHSLTHSLTHYYYCSYCYYYGDYCQYCFYFRDYQWLQRMYWAGNRVPAPSEMQQGPAPKVTKYNDGMGYTPNSYVTPESAPHLKAGGFGDRSGPTFRKSVHH